MKLLGNRLLVKPILQEKTDGGIHIPAQAQERTRFGGPKLWDVLQVGTKQTEVQPGDRVITFSYTSGALPLDDGTSIVNDADVLVILPKDPNRYET